jgi:hypothetical protein
LLHQQVAGGGGQPRREKVLRLPEEALLDQQDPKLDTLPERDGGAAVNTRGTKILPAVDWPVTGLAHPYD